MNDERIESLLNGLLRYVLVPPGFRATNDTEEDAALEALGDVPISSDQHGRLLRKINGEEPYFNAIRENAATDTAAEEALCIDKELAAMFRQRDGDDFSEELEERLKEFEREAMEFDQDGDDSSGSTGEDDGGQEC